MCGHVEPAVIFIILALLLLHTILGGLLALAVCIDRSALPNHLTRLARMMFLNMMTVDVLAILGGCYALFMEWSHR